MDCHYMKIALEEARKAYNKGEVPIGAIVVQNNKIIGRGHNLKESLQDATAHAEILALRQAYKHTGGWRLTASTLYVTIEPCAMCAGAILQSRVSRLVIGAMDPKAGACGSILNLLNNERFNHQVEISRGILEDESANIIKNFFIELREK